MKLLVGWYVGTEECKKELDMTVKVVVNFINGTIMNEVRISVG